MKDLASIAPSSQSFQLLVVGDTHLTEGARLPDNVLRLAEYADLVAITGDCTEIDIVDTIKSLAPVIGCCGNCDSPEVAAEFPLEQLCTVATITVGMRHIPLEDASRYSELCATFSSADLILYGHTHRPDIHEFKAGSYIMNPGSACQPRGGHAPSVGWVEVDDGKISAIDIVNL